ncbi:MULTISPECIES: hypothetical protein [unclassified Streptomyces]|uniref:hypothetical protein n=1 Tax=unclassified Streptomyces TaxID=2593676 RepID=UPI00036C90EB|nr:MULTISPECIES: hypothetical protein [unclassified Streptomyces]MYT31721.1 hypothetical protein [Streptomyces sp. SID8354]
MTIKAVDFRTCECGAKRAFEDERIAEKALGRAQAKRHRAGDRRGSRRGLYCENRYYECEFGMYHLTSQSRSECHGVAA